jgi:succinate dehydrogenase/fumarate reductase cytochrome b subunit
MDIFLRPIAIFIEVLILAVITYSVFNGIRLTIFDLGAGPKYGKIITMALLAVGFIALVFFIAHLTAFYPEV